MPKVCQEYLLEFPGSPLPTHDFFLLISDRVLSLNTGEREVKGTANFLAANSLVKPRMAFFNVANSEIGVRHSFHKFGLSRRSVRL